MLCRNSRRTLFGFLIVISPPDDISTYVNNLKTEFYHKYGPYDGRYSKPHITVCNFPLLEERQNKVLAKLQNGLANIKPFEIELSGFGSFVNGNVIYIDIVESEELESLRRKFIYMNVDIRLGKKFSLFNHPHLTIAKTLDTHTFESAKLDYLPRSYVNSFVVEKLKILRYDFDKERYFDFGNLMLGTSS